MRGSLPRQIAELTCDLRLHVEWRLPARHPARVARQDERPDLLEELGIRHVVPPAWARERLQLGLDVRRGLAARGAPGVAGAEHLADLVVALRPAHGRGCGPAHPARAHVAVLADREPTAPDVVVHPPAPEQRDDRDHGADADHGEDDDAQRVLHPSGLSPMWRRLRRRTMAPRRPILFPDQWALALVTA